jgi:hypothetical protein
MPKTRKKLQKKRRRRRNYSLKLTTNNAKAKCSPKPKHEINEFSCYTNDDLYHLRDLWNVRHSDLFIHSNEPKDIHALLSGYMKNVCSKETCWLKQHFANDSREKLKDSFAPEHPMKWLKNPNEWLDSNDINKVMKQYEKAYKCFDFMGPTPIDFDKRLYGNECVWSELCDFDIGEQMKKGKTKIGIIFNTDEHDEPGEHWISMFINLKKQQIYFFDSAGDKPPKEITAFVKKIKEQGSKLGMDFQYDQNHPVEHQYKNTECGVYSLFFIVHMLEDKITGEYLKTHILKDEYMEKFRKVFFNEPN